MFFFNSTYFTIITIIIIIIIITIHDQPLKKSKHRGYSSLGEYEFGKSRISPQAEEFQRRSWHQANRHSMTASMFSSYALGDALHKSPSDKDRHLHLGNRQNYKLYFRNIIIIIIVIIVSDFENRDSIHQHKFLSLDEIDTETEEKKRKRLASELTDQIENFDYSNLREIMDGTITPLPQSSTELNPIHQHHITKEFPLQYESLSSVMKRSNYSDICLTESMDDWVNVDKKDLRS